MPSLFDPVRLGAIELSNRIVMAPLTRCRAENGRVPGALAVEYYRQRSSAGLILTEATSISPQGVGYPNTPGLWSEEQVAGWKKVTEAVHKEGGKIVAQLWHVGRISDPVYLEGQLPVAPSAIAAEGHVSLIRPMKPYVTPRALDASEIPGIVEDYRKSAANAREAGFDGVEIHGANGYLPDQFLHTDTNKRTDAYGGPVENRARFLLEAVDAAISVWGADRVGVHLSPRCGVHSITNADSAEVYSHLAAELGKRRVAFLFLRESQAEPRLTPEIRRLFGGATIANQELTRDSGSLLLSRGEADAVSYGHLFISNPDLPKRFALSAPLNVANLGLLMTPGPEGYTDYPSL